MCLHGEMVRVEVGKDGLRVAVSRFVGTKHIVINARFALVAFDIADLFVRVARGGHVGHLIGTAGDAIINKE